MAKQLINPLVVKRLQMFIARPTHALLLTGEKGSGHSMVSDFVIKAFQEISNANVVTTLQTTEKQHITIEQVRELRSLLKLKATNSSDISRIIVINSIDVMLEEAQNALLKMLEEPTSGVLFIVFSYQQAKMLPTISSRCVQIKLLPIALTQAKEYFGNNLLDSNYTLSGGSAELLQALQVSIEHPLSSMVAQAKELLSATPYERLVAIDVLAKQKEQVMQLIDVLQKMCAAGLRKSTNKTPWLKKSKQLQIAKKRMAHHVQTKLALDELFLGL